MGTATRTEDGNFEDGHSVSGLHAVRAAKSPTSLFLGNGRRRKAAEIHIHNTLKYLSGP